MRSQEDIPNYGYADTVYWLRLHLQNETSTIDKWLLETAFPNLNYVDLYIPSDGGGFVKKIGRPATLRYARHSLPSRGPDSTAHQSDSTNLLPARRQRLIDDSGIQPVGTPIRVRRKQNMPICY